MENSSRYGGTIGGVYLFLGLSGVVGSIAGIQSKFGQETQLLKYWMSMAVIVSFAATIVMLISANKQKETFGMGAIYRVAKSVFPPCFAGASVGISVCLIPDAPQELQSMTVAVWIILFGCAINSASFVILKGLKYLSWIFIFGGSATTILFTSIKVEPVHLHLTMGIFFGLMLLIYSLFLFFIEKPSPREKK